MKTKNRQGWEARNIDRKVEIRNLFMDPKYYAVQNEELENPHLLQALEQMKIKDDKNKIKIDEYRLKKQDFNLMFQFAKLCFVPECIIKCRDPLKQ